MSNPGQSNWRTVPAFNYEYDNLPDAVRCAINEFSKRQGQTFLIMRHHTKQIYLCIPWSQYRAAPVDHPCSSSSILFKGDLMDLRAMAYSFPPDLLTSFPSPQPDLMAEVDAAFPERQDATIPPEHKPPFAPDAKENDG